MVKARKRTNDLKDGLKRSFNANVARRNPGLFLYKVAEADATRHKRTLVDNKIKFVLVNSLCPCFLM